MKFVKSLFALLAVVFCLGFAYSGEAKATETINVGGRVKYSGAAYANKRVYLRMHYVASGTSTYTYEDKDYATDGSGDFTGA